MNEIPTLPPQQRNAPHGGRGITTQQLPPPSPRKTRAVASGRPKRTNTRKASASKPAKQTQASSLSREAILDIIRSTEVKNAGGRIMCPLDCDKSFKRLLEAKRHALKSCLSNPYLQRIACPHCGEDISTRRDAVARHLRRAHDYDTQRSNVSAVDAAANM
jgi:hypothetical protein